MAHKMDTVTIQVVHIKFKMSYTLSLCFAKFIDLYSPEGQEEINVKFMSFSTSPTDRVEWLRFIITSRCQHLRQLLNMSFYLGLTVQDALGVY